jgi:hypothetical protein
MNINYTTLLTKLKVELLERAAKKPKIERTFYPSEAQSRLLNVCGFIDFLNPPRFSSLTKVTEFVTNFVNKRNEFEKEYKSISFVDQICHKFIDFCQ